MRELDDRAHGDDFFPISVFLSIYIRISVRNFASLICLLIMYSLSLKKSASSNLVQVKLLCI